jgi:hypothetical protein
LYFNTGSIIVTHHNSRGFFPLFCVFQGLSHPHRVSPMGFIWPLFLVAMAASRASSSQVWLAGMPWILHRICGRFSAERPTLVHNISLFILFVFHQDDRGSHGTMPLFVGTTMLGLRLIHSGMITSLPFRSHGR